SIGHRRELTHVQRTRGANPEAEDIGPGSYAISQNQLVGVENINDGVVIILRGADGTSLFMHVDTGTDLNSVTQVIDQFAANYPQPTVQLVTGRNPDTADTLLDEALALLAPIEEALGAVEIVALVAPNNKWVDDIVYDPTSGTVRAE